MRGFTKEDCLWLRIQKADKPIVLYGTGNGADKILDACIVYGIEISGVFASNGFVRDRRFRGFPVESLEMLEERLGDFIVLLCFGTTRDEVVEAIRTVASRHTLYIPDVPLYGGELFDFDYYEKNRAEIESAYELFEDDYSKVLFEDMIAFRLSGEGKYLTKVESAEESYKNVLSCARETFQCVIDCGAFTGDSALDLCKATTPKKLIAVEPDGRSFKKLSAYAQQSDYNIIPVNSAIGDDVGSAEFIQGGSRSSGVATLAKRSKAVSVDIVTVDSLAEGEIVDAIKYDVEGEELAALKGSFETIKEHHPTLAVSVYHRSCDIFSLIHFIRGISPEYKFYMRRVPCIPAWDITLFAV